MLLFILKEEQEARQKRREELKASQNGVSEESESDELNESELIELPFFLRALFDWLLDHHAVSCAICDNHRTKEDKHQERSCAEK